MDICNWLHISGCCGQYANRQMTNRLLKIISTNWRHLLGFYVTIYLSFIIFKIIGLGQDYEWDILLGFGFVSAGILMLTYGLQILGYFVLTIVTMDILSFSWT